MSFKQQSRKGGPPRLQTAGLTPWSTYTKPSLGARPTGSVSSEVHSHLDLGCPPALWGELALPVPALPC